MFSGRQISTQQHLGRGGVDADVARKPLLERHELSKLRVLLEIGARDLAAEGAAERGHIDALHHRRRIAALSGRRKAAPCRRAPNPNRPQLRMRGAIAPRMKISDGVPEKLDTGLNERPELYRLSTLLSFLGCLAIVSLSRRCELRGTAGPLGSHAAEAGGAVHGQSPYVRLPGFRAERKLPLDLIVSTDRGLYCAAGDFHIDPVAPRSARA